LIMAVFLIIWKNLKPRSVGSNNSNRLIVFDEGFTTLSKDFFEGLKRFLN